MLFIYDEYHQGEQVFGDKSRGRQCMTNCVVFSALSQTKPLHLWTSEHFCGVLHSFLLYNDISRNFSFQRQKYVFGREVSYGGTLTKKIYYQNDFSVALEFAFNLILSSRNSKFSAILFFCASAISVRKTNNEYYLFDSHSLCRNGLLDPDGACHISKYENLSELCSFLRDVACSLSSSSLEQIEYEMIRVEVKTTVNAGNENFIIFNINVGNHDSGRSSDDKSSKETFNTSSYF